MVAETMSNRHLDLGSKPYLGCLCFYLFCFYFEPTQQKKISVSVSVNVNCGWLCQGKSVRFDPLDGSIFLNVD